MAVAISQQPWQREWSASTGACNDEPHSNRRATTATDNEPTAAAAATSQQQWKEQPQPEQHTKVSGLAATRVPHPQQQTMPTVTWQHITSKSNKVTEMQNKDGSA